MLTTDELNEIEHLLECVPSRRSGCIDALKVVQKHRGWVSDDALRDVAAVVDMTPSEVDSVATFYNLIFRRPVGRHVILVCDSVSCWLTGQETVLSYLQRRLGIQPGETTPDGQFTLLPTVCLGHCEQAPVMMLDGEILGNLTEPRIDEALDAALRMEGG